jgi:hypothetical protein
MNVQGYTVAKQSGALIVAGCYERAELHCGQTVRGAYSGGLL